MECNLNRFGRNKLIQKFFLHNIWSQELTRKGVPIFKLAHLESKTGLKAIFYLHIDHIIFVESSEHSLIPVENIST